MLIVAITGMPGAGKSTAAKALEVHGFELVVMGDVIREETRRRGLEPNEKNTGKVMLELRREYGPGAVAEVCLRSIKAMKEKVVIVDGLRSLAEAEVFASHGKVKVLAIHASPERRFRLLSERARSDAPTSREGFDEREKRELTIGVGDAVALADDVLSNEHDTPEELGNRAVELVEWWVSTTG